MPAKAALAALATSVCMAAIACGGPGRPAAAHTHPASPASPSAASVAASSPQSTSPADCATAMQAWLADTSWSPLGNETVQQGIKLMAQNAKTYITTFASDPGSDAATTFLGIMGDSGQPVMNLPSDIPSCADPGGYYADAQTQYGNAVSTDAGTSQAAADMHAVLSDLRSLSSEARQDAPGSGLTLPA